MRKTNTNIKCLRYLKQIILWFVLGHVVFIGLFLMALDETRPIRTELCKVDVILVEDTEYIHHTKWSDDFYIYSKGRKYVFPALSGFDKYVSRELNDIIEVGETLSVTYIEGTNSNFVYDARDGQDVYVDMESLIHDQKISRILVLIIFAVLEVVFLCILFLSIRYHRKMLKRFFQNIYGDKKKNVS